jgi:hypothetical protein
MFSFGSSFELFSILGSESLQNNNKPRDAGRSALGE